MDDNFARLRHYSGGAVLDAYSYALNTRLTAYQAAGGATVTDLGS